MKIKNKSLLTVRAQLLVTASIALLLIGFTNCSKTSFVTDSPDAIKKATAASGLTSTVSSRVPSAATGSSITGASGASTVASGTSIISGRMPTTTASATMPSSAPLTTAAPSQANIVLPNANIEAPKNIPAPALQQLAPWAVVSRIILGEGGDDSWMVYTEVPTTEEVFVCLQSDHGNNPCVNDRVNNYEKLSQVDLRDSNNPKWLWISKSIYRDPKIDFGTYTAYFAKKDKNGNLAGSFGTVKLAFFLKSLAERSFWKLNPDGPTAYSTSGPNKFYMSCLGSGDSIPSDFKRYNYYYNDDKECYYKITQ